MKASLLIHNISHLYTQANTPPVKGKKMSDIICLDNAYLACNEAKIIAFGSGEYDQLIDEKTVVIDANGMILLPGLIDSHTHLVHGGSREDEFALKLEGVPYLEILKQGGGILSTVQKTKAASFKELYDKAKASLDEMLLYGVTTIEAKSGYGLDLDTEIKQLEVAKKLNHDHPIDIVSTYLGAHAYPEEYKDNKKAFVDKIINDLETIKKLDLAKFVDVFCEEGVFGLQETEAIISRAKEIGLIPRLHADEMHPLGGAGLGIKYQAASVDHLMAVSDQDIMKLAESDTIANLLPATSFFLNKAYAPARKLIDSGAAVAVSSDYNPGSTPSENFQLTLQIAGNKLRMLPNEILTASTINPAYHLGVAHDRGSIAIGKNADFVLMKASNIEYLIYHYGINHTAHVFKNGVMVVKDRQICY
ncbi:MAG: imidazolonepropionase [Candidatus Izemoplasmatales bacterium]|nr:imidazolonepropionase [Candidatus Izemoplasmatales bacterium]